MLLPGRSDGEETTGEATAVSAMTGNDRRAERASNDEPDGTAQATTGLTTLPLAHLSVDLTRSRRENPAFNYGFFRPNPLVFG
jgi:hypothetical protein